MIITIIVNFFKYIYKRIYIYIYIRSRKLIFDFSFDLMTICLNIFVFIFIVRMKKYYFLWKIFFNIFSPLNFFFKSTKYLSLFSLTKIANRLECSLNSSFIVHVFPVDSQDKSTITILHINIFINRKRKNLTEFRVMP